MVDLYCYHVDDESVCQAIKTIRQWHRPNLRLWLDEESCKSLPAGGVRSVSFIDANVSLSNGLFCFEWLIDSFAAFQVHDSGRKALIQRLRSKSGSDFVVFSSESRRKSRFVGFVDASGDASLPDGFYRIPWFDSLRDVESYCRDRGVFDFDLTDSSRYQDTHRTHSGAPVYLEIATGNVIYLDTFHDDHYEVFNSNGKHLGEMSKTGWLDMAKADPNKYYRL